MPKRTGTRRPVETRRRGGNPSKSTRGAGPAVRLSRPPGRRALLASTALVSTVLLSALAAPAAAPVTCAGEVGDFINLNETDPIVCINTLPRDGTAGAGGAAINLFTSGDGNSIFLDSDGQLQSSAGAGGALGISASTDGIGSFITIQNRGDIDPVVAEGIGRDAK